MQSQQKQYEYLEHTADVKFLAYGKTLEEVFENAALAMFNVMIDTGKISGGLIKNVYLKSPDLESLIVDWLSEHLYIFEVDEIVFSKFHVDRIIRSHPGHQEKNFIQRAIHLKPKSRLLPTTS